MCANSTANQMAENYTISAREATEQPGGCRFNFFYSISLYLINAGTRPIVLIAPEIKEEMESNKCNFFAGL